ncbi:MAG: nucleotide exchange factor GrpE [Candidatus Colwellbacteria bacterium]|nr:nucleotide exchange factor GrpE [Candidatus Colwellbacteria bacterium]
MTDKEKEEEKLLEGVDEVKDLPKRLEKADKEKEEYLDGWKRAKADLINYKKEERQRLEQVIKFSNEGLVLDLISVLDDFDLALAALERSGPVEKGVYLIKSRLEDFLKRQGLTRIGVMAGDKFDPAIHEAIVAVEVQEGLPADSAFVATSAKEAASAKAGTVAEEIEAGYMLHGKVIRPTRVKVYK